MAYDYNAIIVNTVIPQIRDKGTDVVLKRVLDVTAQWEHHFDPVTFEEYWENIDTSEIVYTEPTGSTVSYVSKCVITDFTEEERVETSIKVGDKKVLSIELPPPQQGDVYNIRGVDYQYVNHNTIAPGDVDVLYKIQVRV